MTLNELKRRFPNASPAFIEANLDRTDCSRVPVQPEQVDWKKVLEAYGGGAVETQYRLCHIEVEFFAKHGKRLDEDNRRYVVKPILDALVQLGFACDDKDITTETTQRMDKTNP